MKKTILLLVFAVILNSAFSQHPNAVFQGKPHINDPKVTAAYPNTPFLFYISTSGQRPIKWSAKGLPEGLKLNPETGIITGSVAIAGSYIVKLKAANDLGNYKSELRIEIGKSLALTPVMGWNSWNTFTSTLDAELVKQIADVIVESGMRELGYHYINIDDFWQLKDRDANGNIQINKEKFPNGIKEVADYVHSKGLKLGIYSDAAPKTCGGVAGSLDHEYEDAKAYAEWGVDLLKYDYCHAPVKQDTAIRRYTTMNKALLQANRSIVYSICEWGRNKPATWAKSVGGEYWRTTWDIRDTWDHGSYNSGHNGIMQILDINAELDEYAGPGHFNDPDMLIVGIHGKGKATSNNKGAVGCTDEEYRSHMSLWCLMAAPLLCGNDLRNMSEVTKETLMNPEIIEINQDELGKQAKRVVDRGNTEIFIKPLKGGSYAVGLLNRDNNQSIDINFTFAELGLEANKYKIRDVWAHSNLGKFKSSFSANVPVHGCNVYILSRK